MVTIRLMGVIVMIILILWCNARLRALVLWKNNWNCPTIYSQMHSQSLATETSDYNSVNKTLNSSILVECIEATTNIYHGQITHTEVFYIFRSIDNKHAKKELSKNVS